MVWKDSFSSKWDCSLVLLSSLTAASPCQTPGKMCLWKTNAYQYHCI